jgi:hypothetical protein
MAGLPAWKLLLVVVVLALQVHVGCQEYRAHAVLLVVQLVLLVLLVQPEHVGCLVHRDHKAMMVLLVQLVHVVHRVRVMGLVVCLVLVVRVGHRGCLVAALSLSLITSHLVIPSIQPPPRHQLWWMLQT